MEVVETFCKLCRNAISDECFKGIEEITSEVLDVLLLKLSAQEKNILVRCNTCCTKLFAAFNFKAVCTDTEDCIFPYVHSQSGAPVDLREVYLKERGKEHLKDILGDERICRLCLQVVTCEFTSVGKVDVVMLRKYIPEVNFNSTKQPVICKLCLDALAAHTNFLNSFLNVKEDINDICDNETIESLDSIKYEDIEVRFEEKYSDTSLLNLKDETDNCASVWSSEPAKTTNNSTLKDISEKQIYRCDSCDYKSIYKRYLKQHQRIHKKQFYKCVSCDFKTIYKFYLLRHQQRRHKDTSEDQMYECDSCDYKTGEKRYLTQHQLVHKDISEKQMYECDSCDFKSIYKKNLIRHQHKHKKRKYKCDSCNFKTAYEYSLQQHHQRHDDIPGEGMYKCDSCDYKTGAKLYLAKHELKHKKISEEQMYKCDSCDFKSIYKSYLTQHQLQHKKQLYECDSCDFKTNYKYYLARHQQKHKDFPDDQM